MAAAAASSWLAPRHRASAIVGVEWSGTDIPADAVGAGDNASRRLQVVQQHVADPVLLRRVVTEAAPGLETEELASSLRVLPMASSAYRIEFVHHDPRTAALVPNAICRLLQEEQQALDRAGSGPGRRGPLARFELLREAVVPAAPDSPPLPLVALGGALVGLVVGLALAAHAELRDRSVKGPEDLVAILPVPVLAVIPELRSGDRDSPGSQPL